MLSSTFTLWSKGSTHNGVLLGLRAGHHQKEIKELTPQGKQTQNIGEEPRWC